GSDWDRNTKQPDCLNAVKRHEIGCIQWALLSCLLLCRAISPIALVCFTLRYTLAAPFLDVSTAPIFQTIVPLANLPLQDLQPYKPYQTKKIFTEAPGGKNIDVQVPRKQNSCKERMPGGSLRGLSERV
ncbi:hypothetical protein PSTT_15567, partial [Puccinia striiformis]